MRVRLALEDYLELLQDFQLEIEKVIVVDAQELLDASCCYIPYILILVCQFLTDQL